MARKHFHICTSCGCCHYCYRSECRTDLNTLCDPCIKKELDFPVPEYDWDGGEGDELCL